MPSETDFQSFFKYNKWMLAINAIMTFVILCIMIWIAVTVNSKIQDIQNKINSIQKPVSAVVSRLEAPLKNLTTKVKDTVLNRVNTLQKA